MSKAGKLLDDLSAKLLSDLTNSLLNTDALTDAEVQPDGSVQFDPLASIVSDSLEFGPDLLRSFFEAADAAYPDDVAPFETAGVALVRATASVPAGASGPTVPPTLTLAGDAAIAAGTAELHQWDVGQASVFDDVALSFAADGGAPAAPSAGGDAVHASGSQVARSWQSANVAEAAWSPTFSGTNIVVGQPGGLQFAFNNTGGVDPGSQAEAGFIAAAELWESFLQDPITVNLDIGFQTLGAGILGSTGSTTAQLNYAPLRTALIGDQKSADDATAVGSLEDVTSLSFWTNASDGARVLDNDGSGNNFAFDMNTANLKALGVAVADGPDGHITFSSDFTWDFDRSDGITAGAFDFVAVAFHEIGHALGFVSGVDVVDIASGSGPQAPTDLNNFRVFSALDLYRYSAAGVRELTYGGTPYFSINGGTTNLALFSTGSFNGDGRQASHWKDNLGIGIMDPTLSPGTLGIITARDIQAMDVMGWDLVTTGSVSIGDVSVSEGDSGTKLLTFTVTRTGGTAAFSVDFATADDSATTASNDYVANNGTLSFGVGENSQTVSVTINGDTQVESDETFFVSLSNANNGATISDGQGIGTIQNDDMAPTVDLSSSVLSVTDTSVVARISNGGTATAPASTTGIYLSTNATISPADLLLNTASAPSVAPGGFTDQTVSIVFPSDIGPGTFYVGIFADHDGQIGESDEINNTTAVPVILGDAGTNALIGTGDADIIIGFAGTDFIDGGANADAMYGGADDDWYFVDNSADLVREAAGQGANDRVLTSVSYTLDASQSIETLMTNNDAGTSDIDLTGNELAQSIFGNAGANRIDGGGAADVMAGRGGDDMYFVENALDVVNESPGGGSDRVFASVSYTLKAGQAVEKLTTAGNSGTGAINLTGNELANIIFGNAGANTLDGKGGADDLNGLGGDDFYFVDNALDMVNEAVGAGNDRVFASVSFTLKAGQEIEKLSTNSNAGTGAINLTGNERADVIFGNNGANTLDGKAGADNLNGLGGDDFYYVDSALDVVTEAAGGGSDRVFASVSYTLKAGQEIEKLTTDNNVGTGAINLTGNELANTIFGNAGTNSLDGKGGGDDLNGLGGDDFYYVDNALDVVNEASGGGSDRVFASGSYTLKAGQEIEKLTTDSNSGTGAINLTGNELANDIFGNAGGNTINGGAGKDSLVGLGGHDHFRFDTALNATTNVDTVSDFTVSTGAAAETDKIDLAQAIFATLGTGALAPSAFTTSAPTNPNQHIVYNTTTGALFYDDDGNGPHTAVQFALLSTHPALTAADILVA